MIPRCPACRERLFQVTEGVIKLRTNILIFKADGVGTLIKCPRCKADVPLDLQLGSELRKALAVPERKLVLRKTLDLPESAK